MNSLVARLRQWLAGIKPWPVTGTEFLLMRLLVVGTLWSWCPYHTYFGLKEQPMPVGLAHWFDLTWLGDKSSVQLVIKCVQGGLIVYALASVWQWLLRHRPASRRPLDWISPIALLIVMTGQILVQTNRNSLGAVHHGYQAIAQATLCLVAFHFIVLIKGLRGQREPRDRGLSWEAWGAYLAIAVLAATYTCAGTTKLRREGLMWVWDAPQVATHMARTQDETYHDKLIPEEKDELEPYIQWVAHHPMLTRIGFAGTLALEFFAFVALLGPRWAFWTGIGIELLHAGIGFSMKLYFPESQAFVFAFLINVPGRLLAFADSKGWSWRKWA